jgi:two-component system cell cycle response regulator
VMVLAEQGGVAIENVFLHDEARRLSITDGLTGVWNRRYFQMQFRQVLATSVRFRRPFSILMLDLDNFKSINDMHGHQRGDAILIEFAQRVNRVLREVDTFARYGGEEFICLLSETDVYGALTTAEKIREVIRADTFGATGDEPVKLTVSIGLASYPEHAESYKALVGAADQALYKAKNEGRDRVRIAQKPPPPPLKLAK